MQEKKFRTPKQGEVRAKRPDYLSSNEFSVIRKLTGLDPFDMPDDQDGVADKLALCGWFAVALSGEFAGISLDEVRDWPMGVFAFDDPDDDADDVAQASADLAEGAADDEDPFTGPSEPA